MHRDRGRGFTEFRTLGPNSVESPVAALPDVAGMSEQDRNAMREFVRSDRAPEMVGRMTQMARGMGHGDVMAGMTRMTDMMGSTGRDGMMGGGGMMKSAPPSK